MISKLCEVFLKTIFGLACIMLTIGLVVLLWQVIAFIATTSYPATTIVALTIIPFVCYQVGHFLLEAIK